MSGNLETGTAWGSSGKPTKKWGWVWIILGILAGLIVIASVVSNKAKAPPSPSTPTPVTQKEPAYIKDVVAYKEGNGAMVVYFVLATAAGEETRADGTVRLQVYEKVMNTDTYKMEDRWLWTLLETPVAASDFHTAEVGQGAFAHKRLICSLGRILYSRFNAQPSQMTGTVKIIFRTISGRELPGEGTIFF